MSNENVKIDAYFRKFPEGDVIAIWEEESDICPNYRYSYGSKRPSFASYMHVGQHSDCCPELISDLEVASEKEYLPLKKELESIGYDVSVL